jgi:hypothetical protein
MVDDDGDSFGAGEEEAEREDTEDGDTVQRKGLDELRKHAFASAILGGR